MTSTAELVNTIRNDLLMSGGRDARNRLASSMTESTDTITLEFTHHLTANDRLSIGYEDMGVWGASGKSISVLRGDNGTTAATHAIGDLVLINAHFTPGQVLRSILAEIQGLRSEPGLFVPSFVVIDAEPNTWTYELPDIDADQVLRVEGEALSDPGEWYRVGRWEVRRSNGTTYLVLHEGWHGQVRVTYKGDYAPIDATTDDVAATAGVGDPTLIAVGAALRLTRGRPIRRSFLEAQGDSRRANEVPGFVTEQSDRNLERWYEDLKRAERRRLLQRYQPRRR